MKQRRLSGPQLRLLSSNDLLVEAAQRKLQLLRAKEADPFTEGTPDLVDYVEHLCPGWDRFDYFKPYAQQFERAATGGRLRICFAAPPQHGKAVADETPMFTRRGWIPADAVEIGDELVGANGQWTKVLGVYPQGEVPLHRVRFTDGSSLVTCGEHRWQVHQRYSGRAVVKTTAELAGDLFESDARCKWRIPIVKPIETDWQDVPVGPYTLGLWLGDGSSYKAEFTTADRELLQAFLDEGYVLGRRKHQNAGRATTYGLKGLLRTLRTLGVLRNKHVPRAYLQGSKEQRLGVLQGLCDTDGWVAKNGSQQAFCTTTPQLAEDFKFLVNSLGGVWTERVRPAAKRISFEIFFRLPAGMPAFRLARKQNRLHAPSAKNTPRRFISAIESVAPGRATCFRVAAADHLFCAGRDLVVTHNTEFNLRALLWLCRFFSGLRHAYVTYNDDRTRDVAKDFERIALDAGFHVSGTLDKMDVRWGDDGLSSSIKFTSVMSSLTGYPVDGLCLIDDPIKDLEQARSPTVRRRTISWFKMVARTRRHVNTSFIVMATRWPGGDLTDYLTTKERWHYVNLKAIAEPANDNDLDEEGRVLSDPLLRKCGESLWRAKPPSFFAEDRKDPYVWCSLYQGEPIPDGQRVFPEPNSRDEDGNLVGARYYTKLPDGEFIRAFGIDLAYTQATRADWSICLEGLVVGASGEERVYLTGIIRKQVEADSFLMVLVTQKANRPNATFRFYAAGTEKGAGSFIRKKLGRRFKIIPASADKLVRSREFALGWKSGRVLLPDPEILSEEEREVWEEFLAVVTTFTGTPGEQDDDVDAGAALWDELVRPKPKTRPSTGGPITYESPLA